MLRKPARNVRLPKSTLALIAKHKIHPREPYYSVIERKLNECKTKGGKQC